VGEFKSKLNEIYLCGYYILKKINQQDDGQYWIEAIGKVKD
jgi:hypothetical protein